MSDIIRLKHGKSAASIRPLGAQIISYTAADGQEIIWQGDPAIWADHTPVLFPIIGNAKDGQVLIDGVPYPMTKHGFARKALFTPIEVTANSATLELTESPETLAQYPFAFSLRVKYELDDDGFRCAFIVQNRSDKPMPFCVGGHPAFIVPMEEGASFEDYHIIFPDDDDTKNLLCPGGNLIDGEEFMVFEPGGVIPLSHQIFDEKDTLLLPDLDSHSVDLVHQVSGRGLRFFWKNMEMLAIWSRPHNHGDYVCLEPWHGMPGTKTESGEFAEKRFATVLKPGGNYVCGFEVELI